jgi:cytochrome bd-type quinol oxidase subunit 1
MSFYGMLAGAIIAGVGAILEGTSAAITGIQSTKVEDPTLKRTLLAAAATVGIGTIFFIVSLVLLFIYQVASKRLPQKAKRFGIAAIIVGIVALLLFITGATIAGIQSNKFKDQPVVYNALKTAAILVAIGILLMLIGYAILYTLLGRKLRR